MKSISMVFAILFCLSLTAPSMANDETQKNEQAPDNKLFEEMFRLPSLIDCGSVESISTMLREYGEQPVVNGTTFVLRPDGVMQPGPFTLFVNPSTKTWSMVVQFEPAGFGVIWCITAAGANFGPAPQNTSSI